MTDPYRDNRCCPTCGGSGMRPLRSPGGKVYRRIRVESGASSASPEEEDGMYFTSYEKGLERLEELAAMGYELHSFAEDAIGTTWMMRWPRGTPA